MNHVPAIARRKFASFLFYGALLALILGVGATARGELALSNFSAAHPIKIMAIGDSITDDCSANGAWRLYLQPLLETNGFPFTFVGRQTSAAEPGFTQTHHEGYCGAVIAPPGVSGAHQYATTDNYLQKVVPDALAISSNTPDLVLILIGANDIGRGRAPHIVATNDMPALLGIIFSNAPNANVILAKITMLQGGTAGGLPYGNYATSVPVYNDALQAMVNQRRAAGQNVFLADMYSAVDYNTMFMADHVHPNPAGLRAMAAEWLARIQAITIRTNQVAATLVHGGESWTYSDTGQDFGTNWAQPDFDDTAWSNGVAQFGYGELGDSTTISYGPDFTNRYATTYFRHWFTVPGNVGITNLNFRLAQPAGAIVWLNGRELYRTNLPPGPVSYATTASNAAAGFSTYIYYQTNVSPPSPPAGTNLLAVEIHRSVNNFGVGFDLELLAGGSVISPPTLSAAFAGGNVILTWPATSGTSFTLYSTTNSAASGDWTISPALVQTNGSRLTVMRPPTANAEFFRLQRQ